MRMNWTRSIVLAAVCAVPLALVAQTAPESDGDRERRGRETGGGGEDEPREFTSGSEFHPAMDFPSREDVEKFEAFMRENSPKRWTIIRSITDADRQQRMRGMLYNRFRMLERLRNADHDMYQVNLRRIGVEDEIFGISYPAVRIEGRSLTPEESSQLREKVAALVDLTLEEREVRVQRLREMLKREEELLTTEKAQREAAIAERLALIEHGRVMSGGGTLGGLNPRRGGDRFGGRRGPGGAGDPSPQP